MRLVLFRLIAILEIAGGFYGFAGRLRQLLAGGLDHGSITTVLALAAYAFVLVAGVLLLENSERGVRFSRWAQLMQLPLIATPVLSYAVHCGGYFNVFAALHLPLRAGLDWHFGSEGFVLAVGGPAASRLGINLLALLSWLVLKLR